MTAKCEKYKSDKKPSRERWESGRTYVVHKKTKLKQQEAEPKRAEKPRMAAPKSATEKQFQHLCRTKSIDV